VARALRQAGASVKLGRIEKLWVADVRGRDPRWQRTLACLQGLVNRETPRSRAVGDAPGEGCREQSRRPAGQGAQPGASNVDAGEYR